MSIHLVLADNAVEDILGIMAKASPDAGEAIERSLQRIVNAGRGRWTLEDLRKRLAAKRVDRNKIGAAVFGGVQHMGW